MTKNHRAEGQQRQCYDTDAAAENFVREIKRTVLRGWDSQEFDPWCWLVPTHPGTSLLSRYVVTTRV
jgi:hypothetical protein